MIDVTAITGSRSKALLKSLENKNLPIRKGDIVSPEPLPQRPVKISYKPLLPNITKGTLLLDDDMSTNKYLTAQSSSRDTYADRKMHLDATKISTGHAYAIYPAPFNKLTNFILAGEVRFVKTEEKYNFANIVFRANNSYEHADGYELFFTNDGGYEIELTHDGIFSPLVAFTSSDIFNRGANASNTFQIIAYGSLFDIYINNKFLVGFEHELFNMGGIQFKVRWSGYSTFDDVKIWEAVQK